MFHGVDHVVGLSEINLVLISDDLSLRLSFEGHLDNVSGFVIKKTMRVSQPRNCTEKNTKKQWLATRKEKESN